MLLNLSKTGRGREGGGWRVEGGGRRAAGEDGGRRAEGGGRRAESGGWMDGRLNLASKNTHLDKFGCQMQNHLHNSFPTCRSQQYRHNWILHCHKLKVRKKLE
jgi:hypothetical protein